MNGGSTERLGQWKKEKKVGGRLDFLRAVRNSICELSAAWTRSPPRLPLPSPHLPLQVTDGFIWSLVKPSLNIKPAGKPSPM